MKLDQNDKARVDGNGDEAQSSSRRSFLRKSSATALVTSLAAQPVWGQCTVSGGMSGASTAENNDDSCIVPLVWGRSPGFWSRAMYNGNAIVSAFSSFEREDKASLRCYIDGIKENSYTIPSTPPVTVKVKDALNYPGGTGGNNWNLAAIWLDAHFGFFDGTTLPGRPNPTEQDWVEHFYALHEVAGDDSPFDAVFDDENASTTWFTQLSGNECT